VDLEWVILLLFFQVDLSIFLPESGQTVQVRVKESANVLTLLFKAAEAGNIKVKNYYAIFETYKDLAIRKDKIFYLWISYKFILPI